MPTLFCVIFEGRAGSSELMARPSPALATSTSAPPSRVPVDLPPGSIVQHSAEPFALACRRFSRTVRLSSFDLPSNSAGLRVTDWKGRAAVGGRSRVRTRQTGHLDLSL